MVRAHKYPRSSRTFQLIPEVLVCQLPVVHPSTNLFNVKNKKKIQQLHSCPWLSNVHIVYAHRYTYYKTYVFWVVPKVTYFSTSGQFWHFFRFYHTTRSVSMDGYMCVTYIHYNYYIYKYMYTTTIYFQLIPEVSHNKCVLKTL